MLATGGLFVESVRQQRPEPAVGSVGSAAAVGGQWGQRLMTAKHH